VDPALVAHAHQENLGVDAQTGDIPQAAGEAQALLGGDPVEAETGGGVFVRGQRIVVVLVQQNADPSLGAGRRDKGLEAGVEPGCTGPGAPGERFAHLHHGDPVSTPGVAQQAQ
jgi:hypothetical protein